MNDRVANAIQALRDKADWLESQSEEVQEALYWEVTETQSVRLYAYSTDDAWAKRRLISGPNVTKKVDDYCTVWERQITEHFLLRLTLPRSSTCKPIMEEEVKYETIDADRINWDIENQCWVMATTTNKRVGWDCGDSDTP